MISKLAYVAEGAKLGENVTVEPFACISADVEIGDGSWIGPGAVVLDGAPAEVLTRADELRALSLEVPFACRLSLDLQARGVPVRTCVSDDELKEELCALRSKM